MEMWRKCGEAASTTAPYSVHHGLYSEAVVSSVVSAAALAEVGRFREAVEYVQKAAKALYEAAKEAFEQVKVTVQHLVELFVEAVARVLAWIDEHKAYLFLMAAVAAGVVALSVALNLWGLVELDKLAYAASLTPFIPAGIREHPREEALRILREAPDPYERFREIAKAAIDKNEKLAEPWESLRKLIMPKPSEWRRLMHGGGAELYSKYLKDENYKRALFYATLALEEAFGVYRTALREYAEGLREVVQGVKVGEEPFERDMYVADLGRLAQLVKKEDKAFEKALSTLREKLNEYAVMYELRDLLDVKEDVARRLAEAKQPELSEFGGVNFGVKAYAALIAYRKHALGRRSAFGAAAWYWLEVGGSARLLYYAPRTAYDNAKRAKAERPVAVEELVAEGLRRLFLKPGADHYRGFVELLGSGRLALMLEDKTESSYVFKLYNMKEGGGLEELDIKLRIEKVGEGITYTLIFGVERWLRFFEQRLEVAMKAAEVVGGRLPVEDRFSYMLGWVDSDVAIITKKGERVLRMTTSHLWQLAETHALFGWSVVGLYMSLTLEGPKLQPLVEVPLDELDEAVRKSAEGGWLKTLGIKAESWDGLKRWVAENWDAVVDAAVKRLGEGVRGELEALRNKLNDDKVAREVAAPVLLLIQAERLGVNEETLRYFGAVVSGAIGGDGHVSAARRVIDLTSGEREIVLLWAAALAAYGIKTKVVKAGGAYKVVASGDDAVKLAGLYFLYGSPLLEGDEKVINHKLYETMKLAAEGLSISWEGLRRTKGGAAADLTLSEAGAAVKYNVYLRGDTIVLQFQSSDQSRAELAARLLKLAGVGAEVKKVKVGGRDVWRVRAATDMLAAGREELRKALAELVNKAVERDWVDADKAERWLEKLERGRVLKERWPKYEVGLVEGALRVRYRSINSDGIEREAQRLREMGLEEGKHFTVKKPEGGGRGYVRILREGLERAAWLSVHGTEDQRKLAADFVERILQRAREAGSNVYEKASKIVEEGMSRGSLTLKGFVKEVEVNGVKYKVKVIDGEAVEEDRGGRKLLRLKITAEVGGVRSEYTITYGRYGKLNAALGRTTARADAPGGREADAERFSALVEALTGKKPRVYRRSGGRIDVVCGREHLEGFMRYAELADAIKRWLEETGS